MEFPQIVRLARRKNDMTQADLAGLLDIADTNISAYENGRDGQQKWPTLENLRKMAEKFKMTTSQLLGETDIPAHLLFKNQAEALAAGQKWDEPVKAKPRPFQPDDQEPGRFLMRLNLEDCELLSLFNQMDSQRRRILLANARDSIREQGQGREQSE